MGGHLDNDNSTGKGQRNHFWKTGFCDVFKITAHQSGKKLNLANITVYLVLDSALMAGDIGTNEIT